jgi:serine/threonine protein kinase
VQALRYAHETVRIVRRDLKPANLMLTAAGELKVMDFGIARSLGDSMSRLSKASQAHSGGPLPYMSPQQLMDYPPSVRDDVYSLGATIYELLTGKPPFFRGGDIGNFHSPFLAFTKPPRIWSRACRQDMVSPPARGQLRRRRGAGFR